MANQLIEVQPRPSRHDMLMDMAEVVSLRGTCNKLKVGAVIALYGRALSTGYNGPPATLPHCDHQAAEFSDTPTRPCEDAVHAEANALAFAARHGTATEGADLYVTHSPCLTCAKLLINAGLASVYFRVPFRDASGILLLTRANVRCLKFNGGNDFEYWTG